MTDDPIEKLRQHVEKHKHREQAFFSTAGLKVLLNRLTDAERTVAALKAQVERLLAKEGKRISDELLRTDRQAGSLTDEQYAAAIQPYTPTD